jgi:signal transduction histidine kinase
MALFAGFALAAALALATEALLGVLVETDAVAYPLLVVVALALWAMVRADARRILLAQRLAVGAMAAYLVLTEASWLLWRLPAGDYALATFTPWVLCTQLLIFTSWPARAALLRSSALLALVTLPLLLAVLVQGPVGDWALRVMPVTVNALMAQLVFGAVMVGLSTQIGLLMQLVPDSGGQHLSAQDLLQRGQAERERARRAATAGERAKSSFIAVVSHELRTPLHAMRGFIDVVLRDGLPPTQAAALHQARDASDRLDHLLTQTLQFTLLEDGHVALDEQPHALAPLARAAVASARAACRGRPLVVDLEWRSPSLQGAQGWLLLDAQRLQQVLAALLDNAVRFTQAGSVRLVLEQLPLPPPRLRLEVHDTGIGMDSQTLARVAQPFSQAADPLTRSRGGLGLGLAIARRLVQQMGGELQLSSQVGVGTVAAFELPWHPVPGAFVTVAGDAVHPGPAAADDAEPDTQAWCRAAPDPLHAAQRRDLLHLLADHDSAALAAWNSQRAAWSGVLPLAERAQVDQAMAEIDFERALAVLQRHHDAGAS